MKYQFFYHFPRAETVALIGDFNNWDARQQPMCKNDEGLWVTGINLTPGHHRYKFLIDNIIRLNDPYAGFYVPDEKEELFSLLVINNDHEQVKNIEEYHISLVEYDISDRIYQARPEYDKRSFRPTDNKVVLRFEFQKVTGAHTATVLWYGPGEKFYTQTEGILTSPEERSQPAILWFWINIAGFGLPVGKWNFCLYINGAPVFKDYFTIQPLGYDITKGSIILR